MALNPIDIHIFSYENWTHFTSFLYLPFVWYKLTWVVNARLCSHVMNMMVLFAWLITRINCDSWNSIHQDLLNIYLYVVFHRPKFMQVMINLYWFFSAVMKGTIPTIRVIYSHLLPNWSITYSYVHTLLSN